MPGACIPKKPRPVSWSRWTEDQTRGSGLVGNGRRPGPDTRAETVIVGVNQFADEKGVELPRLRVDPSVEREQRDRLETLKTRRDASAVSANLARLEEAARSTANLMPPILDAVRDYATLGEICDTLRDVFGEHRQITTV